MMSNDAETPISSNAAAPPNSQAALSNQSYSNPHPTPMRLHLAVNGVLNWVRGLNPWLLLIVTAHVLATYAILGGRYPITHSFAPNVIWSFEWASQVRQGILYPHWMEHTFGGLGSPSFHFYAPLSMFTVLPFTVLLKMSITAAVLFSTQVALLAMGLGVARLTNELCGPSNRWLAGITGALAVLSTYALLDAYARGAMAETWAMAIIPWLLASLLRSIGSRDPIARYPLIVTTALLGICHPPSFLLVMFTLAFCALITSFNWREVGNWLRRGFVPMLVGICLDGFYLGSAILDQKYVRIDRLNGDNTGMPTYRMLATELGHLSTKMSDGMEGDMIPGFAAGALAAIAVTYFLVRWGHPLGKSCSKPVVFLVATCILSGLMMTDLGRGVYATLPVFNRIQFAWRWLTLYTIVTVALWGVVLLMVNDPERRGLGLVRMCAWIVTLWMATQSQWIIGHMVDLQTPLAQRVDMLFDKLSRTGNLGNVSLPRNEINGGLLFVDRDDNVLFIDVHEYLPVNAPEGFAPRQYAPVEWTSAEGKVSNLVWRDLFRSFEVDSLAGGRILVRTRAWLGWEVDVNGTKSIGDSMGDGGRMAIIVPPGHSRITIHYVGTPNQHFGNWLSLGCLLALIGTYWWLKRNPEARMQ